MFNYYATLGALDSITASISFFLFIFASMSLLFIFVSVSLSLHTSPLSFSLSVCECMFEARMTFYLSLVAHSHFSHPPFSVFRILSERSFEHPRVFHRMPNIDFHIIHLSSSINMSKIRFSFISLFSEQKKSYLL